MTTKYKKSQKYKFERDNPHKCLEVELDDGIYRITRSKSGQFIEIEQFNKSDKKRERDLDNVMIPTENIRKWLKTA